VAGRFCAHCGQEDRTFVLSLGELVYDFVGDTFNYDSRFFRTLWPLLFRPGVLTAEYLRGRRQLFLPPVRMYIFISLVFFFTAALATDAAIEHVVDEPQTPAGEEQAEPVTLTPARELSRSERAHAGMLLKDALATLGLPEDRVRIGDGVVADEDATAQASPGGDAA